MDWKNINTGIAELDTKYEVSSTGLVRSIDRYIKYSSGVTRFHKGRILVQSPDKDGYLRVGLHAQKTNKNFGVHRLVAQAFIKNDNPETKVCVNHKDENKSNNVYTNLEWCTTYYNNHYGVRAINQRIHSGNPCIIINPKTGSTKYFLTFAEASIFLKVSSSIITGYLKGKQCSIANYILIPGYSIRSTQNVLGKLKNYYSSYSRGIIYYNTRNKANYYFSSLDSASKFTGIIKTSISKQAIKGYSTGKIDYAFRKATVYETNNLIDCARLPDRYWIPATIKPIIHTTKIRCLETNEVYNSCSDAARALGTDPSAVSKVCRKLQGHTHGYHLEYA